MPKDVTPKDYSTNYPNIKIHDNENLYINESLKAFNPENTLVIFQYGTDYWKISMYYYPDYQTYLFNTYYSSGKTLFNLLHTKNAIQSYDGKNFIIPINSSTNNIVWIVDNNSEFFNQLQSKIVVKSMILPDGYLLYYSKVNNNTNFTIDNINFIKY